jgi:hypothetical protein
MMQNEKQDDRIWMYPCFWHRIESSVPHSEPVRAVELNGCFGYVETDRVESSRSEDV